MYECVCVFEAFVVFVVFVFCRRDSACRRMSQKFQQKVLFSESPKQKIDPELLETRNFSLEKNTTDRTLVRLDVVVVLFARNV